MTFFFFPLVSYFISLCRRIAFVFVSYMFNWELDTQEVTLILWVRVIRHQVLLDSALGSAIVTGPYHLQTVILTNLGCASFAASKDCYLYSVAIWKRPVWAQTVFFCEHSAKSPYQFTNTTSFQRSLRQMIPKSSWSSLMCFVFLAEDSDFNI